MVIMLAGKILGMVRDRQIAGLFGTETAEAAAYAAMSSIPRNFLDAAFASAISASFIPIFNKHLKTNKETAFKLADTFITLVLTASLALTLLGVAFAPQIIHALYSADTVALATPLLRITLFTVVLSGAAFSLVGVLQSLGGFYAPAAMSIVSNGLIITYIALFMERFGITGLAAVFVLGWFAQILIQIPPLIKRGYIYRPRLRLKDQGLREIGALAMPVMVSTWVIPVNIQVNQRAAQTLAEGGAAAVNTAYTLYAVITGIFVLAIANVVFPKLSREADDPAAFGKTLRETTAGMFFFLIPAAFGLFLLAAPLVSFIFEHGYFDEFSTYRTSGALRFYALGIPGFGLFTILSRGFYARENGKTPLITALFAIGINAALSALLAPRMGVGGPALASAAAINITGIIMLIAMNRRLSGFVTVKTVLNVLKMFLAAAVMAAAVYGIYGLMQGRSNIATLTVCAFTGVIVYFAATLILRVAEAKTAVKSVTKGF